MHFKTLPFFKIKSFDSKHRYSYYHYLHILNKYYLYLYFQRRKVNSFDSPVIYSAMAIKRCTTGRSLCTLCMPKGKHRLRKSGQEPSEMDGEIHLRPENLPFELSLLWDTKISSTYWGNALFRCLLQGSRLQLCKVKYSFKREARIKQ